MATRSRAQTRSPRVTRRSPGDFTGLEKERQARESREEVQERSREVAMMSDAADEEMESGIFDGQSGARLNEPDGDVVVFDLDDDDRPPPPQIGGETPPGVFGPEEEIFTGKENPEDLPATQATRAFVSPPAGLHAPTAVIRTNTDVENMTFGMRNGEPNNYNFREGLAYKVPWDVAEHLAERGLIGQWVTR